MARIVPGIDSVEQHLKCLEDDPEAYRPERYPHCGKAGIHRHGHYERNAPRGEGLAFALSPAGFNQVSSSLSTVPYPPCRDCAGV
jgi:hypothetical protein